MTPIQRYVAICDEHGMTPGQEGDDSASPLSDLTHSMFCLVETSPHTNQTWITLWPTADAAAAYHAGQEYAQDWVVTDLIDLGTNTEYELVVSARAIVKR
jgi:hypothetical protein